MIIYHITTQQEWQQALIQGWYAAPSLATEGFIHCALEHQVEGVLQRYFQNKTGLLKLRIDPSLLKSNLQFDLSSALNESFPHIYGKLNCEAVVDISDVFA
jgi:uncharacterized protein (DUF952 family)